MKTWRQWLENKSEEEFVSALQRGGEGDWVSGDDYDPQTPGPQGTKGGVFMRNSKYAPRLAGFQARIKGVPRNMNPFTTPAEKQMWLDGWDDNQFDEDPDAYEKYS